MVREGLALFAAQVDSRSLFICWAVVRAVVGSRKSSQGFAREIMEWVMPWIDMKCRFWSKEEYVESIGRPRWSSGRDGSSSLASIMRRASAPSDGWWKYGTVSRDESSEM